MTDRKIRAIGGIRPPRPPARTAEDLELEKRPQGDAFSQLLWRQVLAQAIRQARAEAESRHDPILKEKLRKSYRALWGGKQLPLHDDPTSKDPDGKHPGKKRKPHD